MKRPDLDTLACVNPACHLFRRPSEANLTVRKVYGHDCLRLLRCRMCGEEFSERRGTASCNTKLQEATTDDVMNHLDEGCSVRGTARLVKVAKRPWLACCGWLVAMSSGATISTSTASCPRRWNATSNGAA